MLTKPQSPVDGCERVITFPFIGREKKIFQTCNLFISAEISVFNVRVKFSVRVVDISYCSNTRENKTVFTLTRDTTKNHSNDDVIYL